LAKRTPEQLSFLGHLLRLLFMDQFRIHYQHSTTDRKPKVLVLREIPAATVINRLCKLTKHHESGHFEP